MKNKSFVILLGTIAVTVITVLFIAFLFPSTFNGGLLMSLAFVGSAVVMVMIAMYIAHTSSLQKQLHEKEKESVNFQRQILRRT